MEKHINFAVFRSLPCYINTQRQHMEMEWDNVLFRYAAASKVQNAKHLKANKIYILICHLNTIK